MLQIQVGGKEKFWVGMSVLPVSKVVLAQIGTTNQHTVVKNIKFAMLQSYKKNKKKNFVFPSSSQASKLHNIVLPSVPTSSV